MSTSTTVSTSKPWYASKTIWGGLVALAAVAIGFTGHNLAAADQQTAVDAISQMGTLIGSLLAIYGRTVATTTITK